MTPFPAYAPANYQPGPSTSPSIGPSTSSGGASGRSSGRSPQPTAAPPPTERQIEAARRRNASHIHCDGSKCYLWRGDKFFYADWLADALEYGSWWELGQDYPAGELEEL